MRRNQSLPRLDPTALHREVDAFFIVRPGIIPDVARNMGERDGLTSQSAALSIVTALVADDVRGSLGDAMLAAAGLFLREFRIHQFEAGLTHVLTPEQVRANPLFDKWAPDSFYAGIGNIVETVLGAPDFDPDTPVFGDIEITNQGVGILSARQYVSWDHTDIGRITAVAAYGGPDEEAPASRTLTLRSKVIATIVQKSASCPPRAARRPMRAASQISGSRRPAPAAAATVH